MSRSQERTGRRLPSDAGLTARIGLTILLLGAVYLAFVAVLFAAGGSLLLIGLVVAGFAVAQYFLSDRLVLASIGARLVSRAEARLSAKIESFRNQKEVIKAQYSAAQAQVKIGEAFTGVSEEMADVGLAVDRATAKTQEMQARAGAIDELVASGALSDISASGDPLQAELDRTLRSADVDAELAALKQQVGTIPATGAATLSATGGTGR